MTQQTCKIPRLGAALLISGPSGVGKTTVCRLLRKSMPDLKFSVSCTTRAPREGEEDGVDYHFLSRDEFQSRVEAGEFLEYAEVHGNYYGTLKSEVRGPVEAEADVLLDIDVQGARQVRAATVGTPLQDAICYVFLGPPSVAEIEQRLRGRGTDAEDVIQRRLNNAKEELAAWREYDYLVINDIPEAAAHRLECIIRARHCATTCIKDTAAWPE